MKSNSTQQEGRLTIDEIGKKYFPCTCGEIYLSRKLSAPDCPYHSFDWEVAMEEYHNQFQSPLTESELKQSFAEHLGEKELNTTDAYAVEWMVKKMKQNGNLL